MKEQIKSYLLQPTNSAPLAVFRIGFGIMMFLSIIRFWSNGWIEKLYLEPKFHFSYYGFEWIKPLGNFTYLIFFICGLSALIVALGWKYKWAIVTFFLSFTYIELMDKTTYLNHYYFISVVSFVLIFLPAGRRFSIDNYAFAKANKKPSPHSIPRWSILSLKVLISIVYFYAGLAKINSDWLLRAMPLKIWLKSKYDLAFIGENLMQQDWFYYAMSWSGMLYDLTIPFLLLYKRTRWFAYILVIIFHVFTRVLFPIGMFPYVMIVSALIFFDASFHEQILALIKNVIPEKLKHWIKPKPISYKPSRVNLIVVSTVIAIQLLLPFRHLLYPGELFWHEQGFRFSWRVMLIEKVGYTSFKVVDKKSGESFMVDNTDFLSSFQIKQMSFQPDFILEYAHFLEDHFTKQGHSNIAIYVDSYVALNGRRSTRFIDPEIDLTKEKESFKNKNWIIPFNDEIKGL